MKSGRKHEFAFSLALIIFSRFYRTSKTWKENFIRIARVEAVLAYECTIVTPGGGNHYSLKTAWPSQPPAIMLWLLSKGADACSVFRCLSRLRGVGNWADRRELQDSLRYHNVNAVKHATSRFHNSPLAWMYFASNPSCTWAAPAATGAPPAAAVQGSWSGYCWKGPALCGTGPYSGPGRGLFYGSSAPFWLRLGLVCTLRLTVQNKKTR